MSPSTPQQWLARPEAPGEEAAVFAVNAAAFPAEDEARLVDALRADADAWIPGLSTVTLDGAGRVVGHALLTRCTVGGEPALALAPCAVLPEVQGRGTGSAAIRAGLDAARARVAEGGENLVVVLGHAAYYPRSASRRPPAGASPDPSRCRMTTSWRSRWTPNARRRAGRSRTRPPLACSRGRHPSAAPPLEAADAASCRGPGPAEPPGRAPLSAAGR
ncbi:GNAT family N-acetyltransferase [Galactobacter valiniphilus]|uniref:GNAT family N-acetyltransferase n=1 Tax=Galactobacter valiniphilus TaxID=2676122 RepID=UPI001F3FC21F|nr:N-acetyltransferase [Galactobacter valiniphilus]